MSDSAGPSADRRPTPGSRLAGKADPSGRVGPVAVGERAAVAADGEAPGGAAPGPAPEPGSGSSPGSVVRRRRRANVAGGRQHSHKVKVTPEEEAQLLVRAGQQKVSVVRLLVESALADRGETATQRREVLTELLTLRRLVGNLANNVNQIAKVANATDEIRPEAEHYVREARRLMQRIETAVLEVSDR